MAGIFVSYRKEDEPYGAAFLDAVLSHEFGSDVVFRASRSIKPGEDFESRIFQAIRRSAVLLVVIGPNWLARDANGRRRLDDPQDFVRREIAEALRNDVPVVPVLMNADRLAAADLPEDIRAMARVQDVRVHFRHSHIDGPALVDELRGRLPDLASPKPAGRDAVWHAPENVTVNADTVQAMYMAPVEVTGDFVIKSAKD